MSLFENAEFVRPTVVAYLNKLMKRLHCTANKCIRNGLGADTLIGTSCVIYGLLSDDIVKYIEPDYQDLRKPGSTLAAPAQHVWIYAILHIILILLGLLTVFILNLHKGKHGIAVFLLVNLCILLHFAAIITEIATMFVFPSQETSQNVCRLALIIAKAVSTSCYLVSEKYIYPRFIVLLCRLFKRNPVIRVASITTI